MNGEASGVGPSGRSIGIGRNEQARGEQNEESGEARTQGPVEHRDLRKAGRRGL